MTKYIDRMITPQIASEGVTYDRLTDIAGDVEIVDSCTRNCVCIKEGKATVCGKSEEDARLGKAYIRQLSVLFDGKLPVCEFDFFSPVRKYRGFMIDVCRHFRPTDELKRIIDLMSMIGFNYFHWHLTDDQGWRFTVDG